MASDNHNCWYYIIIYPCGNRTKLDLAQISYGMEYEENDYAMASRRHFDNEAEAAEYCRQLARDNNLHYGYDLLD
jgi:hypothetical protein